MNGDAQLWERNSGLPTLISTGGGDNYVHTAGVARDGDDWLLADAVGSVRATVDDTGTTISSQDFSVFGEQRSGTGSFGFAGEQQDPTGQLHLRARQYNPSLGRFTTVDPVQPGAPGTTGYNRYAYSGNNPTTWTDPSGQLATASYANTTQVQQRSAPAAAIVGTATRQVLRMVARELLLSVLQAGAKAPLQLRPPPPPTGTKSTDTDPTQQDDAETDSPTVAEPAPNTAPSTSSSGTRTDEDDRDERSCATEYPDSLREALAWEARQAAKGLGPLPNQTTGVLHTCDTTTLALVTYAGAQYDLKDNQAALASGFNVTYGDGHAEVKLLNEVAPWEEKLAIGVSNNFCSECNALVAASGAIILPPFGRDRGSKGAYWPALG